jgi:hypothetical protein
MYPHTSGGAGSNVLAEKQPEAKLLPGANIDFVHGPVMLQDDPLVQFVAKFNGVSPVQVRYTSRIDALVKENAVRARLLDDREVQFYPRIPGNDTLYVYAPRPAAAAKFDGNTQYDTPLVEFVNAQKFGRVVNVGHCPFKFLINEGFTPRELPDGRAVRVYLRDNDQPSWVYAHAPEVQWGEEGAEKDESVYSFVVRHYMRGRIVVMYADMNKCPSDTAYVQYKLTDGRLLRIYPTKTGMQVNVERRKKFLVDIESRSADGEASIAIKVPGHPSVTYNALRGHDKAVLTVPLTNGGVGSLTLDFNCDNDTEAKTWIKELLETKEFSSWRSRLIILDRLTTDTEEVKREVRQGRWWRWSLPGERPIYADLTQKETVRFLVPDYKTWKREPVVTFHDCEDDGVLVNFVRALVRDGKVNLEARSIDVNYIDLGIAEEIEKSGTPGATWTIPFPDCRIIYTRWTADKHLKLRIIRPAARVDYFLLNGKKDDLALKDGVTHLMLKGEFDNVRRIRVQEAHPVDIQRIKRLGVQSWKLPDGRRLYRLPESNADALSLYLGPKLIEMPKPKVHDALYWKG